MKVSDVMVGPAVFVCPATPVYRVARIMLDSGCTFLPVIENGVPVGIVTSRDIALRVVAEGVAPDPVLVSRIMTSPAVGVDLAAEAEDAVILMRQLRHHRLVVTNHRGELQGVVALGDLVGGVPDGSIAKTVQRLTENSGPALSAPGFAQAVMACVA